MKTLLARPAIRPQSATPAKQSFRSDTSRREPDDIPAVTPEQDAAYLAAVESGDLATARRLVERAALKADMIAQAAWLLGRALAAGYRSLDELAELDRERFAALGLEWRRAHPADALRVKDGSGCGSLDTVACDGRGRIIPLSQRFIPSIERPQIRKPGLRGTFGIRPTVSLVRFRRVTPAISVRHRSGRTASVRTAIRGPCQKGVHRPRGRPRCA